VAREDGAPGKMCVEIQSGVRTLLLLLLLLFLLLVCCSELQSV
jgi:hypothetical protein